MTLGLVRHFRIPHSQRQLVDSQGFSLWAQWYDTCEVEAGRGCAEATSWDICYCSDLARAVFTAETIYKGPIVKTPLLREVPFGPLFATRFKMPLILWQALSRVGWRWAHRSQTESRAQTRARIREFLLGLRKEHPGKRILIVSHGFLMQFLEKELLAEGFRGRVPLRPFWGEVYVFERREK